MADTDLVIRILADTGAAQTNVNALIGAMGKLAGVGVAGATGAAMVQASMTQQDAMARIQTAYNSVDFSSGTARFDEVHNKLVDWSTRLATPFATLAETYGQGARFLDAFGNKLEPAKLDEYTESVTRLSKVSKDLDPTRAGQLVETFAKVYRTENFAGITSAASALSGIHNMGEGPALEGAIAIGQAGAEIGVRPEQALGISNALVDVGMSGQLGAGGMGAAGSSILRQMMLMQQSADNILDPEANYKYERSHREATERTEDLNESLEEAEARRAEMFDSRGRLKRQYLRHPSEKMAADRRVARAQREESDAEADLAHLDELHAGGLDTAGRGGMNVKAMSKTAGMDVDEYAQLAKDDPTEALLKFTEGIGQLPQESRAKALRAAGLKNIRDFKLDEVLAGRDEVIRKSIDMAGGQLANPIDLTSRSDIPLGTTSAKITDVANAGNAALAAAGSQPRQLIDAGAEKLLTELHNNSDTLAKLNEVLTGSSLTDHIVGGVVAGGLALLMGTVPSIITGVLAGKAAVGAGAGIAAGGAGGGGAITAGAAGASALGGILGGAAVGAAVATPFALAAGYKAQNDAMSAESLGIIGGLTALQRATLDNKLGQMGLSEATAGPGTLRQVLTELHITVPNVNVTVSTTDGKVNDPGAIAQQVYNAVMNGIGQAWQHASSAPSSQLGGAR